MLVGTGSGTLHLISPSDNSFSQSYASTKQASLMDPVVTEVHQILTLPPTTEIERKQVLVTSGAGGTSVWRASLDSPQPSLELVLNVPMHELDLHHLGADKDDEVHFLAASHDTKLIGETMTAKQNQGELYTSIYQYKKAAMCYSALIDRTDTSLLVITTSDGFLRLIDVDLKGKGKKQEDEKDTIRRMFGDYFPPKGNHFELATEHAYFASDRSHRHISHEIILN